MRRFVSKSADLIENLQIPNGLSKCGLPTIPPAVYQLDRMALAPAPPTGVAPGVLMSRQFSVLRSQISVLSSQSSVLRSQPLDCTRPLTVPDRISPQRPLYLNQPRVGKSQSSLLLGFTHSVVVVDELTELYLSHSLEHFLDQQLQQRSNEGGLIQFVL